MDLRGLNYCRPPAEQLSPRRFYLFFISLSLPLDNRSLLTRIELKAGSMTMTTHVDSISHAPTFFLGISRHSSSRTIREDDPRRAAPEKRSRGILSLMICTLRVKIAQQSPSCARSSATFHPPAVRRLTVRPPRPFSRSLARCSACPRLRLYSKFSLLFHNFIHFSCQP